MAKVKRSFKINFVSLRRLCPNNDQKIVLRNFLNMRSRVPFLVLAGIVLLLINNLIII